MSLIQKVDDSGRIVIPKDIRNYSDIKLEDPIKMSIDGDKLIIEKHKPANACMITGEISTENLSLVNGQITLSKEAAKQVIHEIELTLSD